MGEYIGEIWGEAMFKKPYYGANISPACAYCQHGTPASDPKMKHAI